MMHWTVANSFLFGTGIALKSTVILGITWVISAVMRHKSAAARHLLWASAWTSVLILPLLSLGMPSWKLPVNQPALSSIVFQTSTSATRGSDPAYDRPANAVVRRRAPSGMPDWRFLFLLLWASGTMIALGRTLGGYLAMARKRLHARPWPIQNAPVACGIDILETERGSMPVAFGVLRPAVLMPEDAAEWTDERRRVVMLHEIAHVRRGDLATQLLARIAWSLHWWNPLAWIGWRSLLNERERATDDLVLKAGTRASEYAAHLLDIACRMQQSRPVECAAIAMARQSHLEARVAAILNSATDRTTPGKFAAALAMLAAVAIMLPLAALQAQERSVQNLPADIEATIRTATSEKNFDALDSIAAVAVGQRKYDVARRLLEASLSIREAASGSGSLDYGKGLLHLGDLERRCGKSAEADDFYRRAIATLGERPAVASAYVHLGTSALVNKNYEAAMQNFERARIADPDHSAPALMWMAVVRARQQNDQEAESLFHQAVSAATPNSPEAATAMELFGQFLKEQARPNEAQPLFDIAATIRKSTTLDRFKDARPGTEALKIGNGVSAPSIITKIEPEYSEEARVAKYQGTAILSVAIGADGVIYQANVVRSLGLGLDEKAIDAITQWKFKPATKDGQPVNVLATIEVNFGLL